MDLGKEMKEIMKEAVIEYVKSGTYNKEKADNVIGFLQRGWKFEEIAEELENLDFMSNKDKLHFNWEDFNNFMDKLKQKYFPKVVK